MVAFGEMRGVVAFKEMRGGVVFGEMSGVVVFREMRGVVVYGSYCRRRVLEALHIHQQHRTSNLDCGLNINTTWLSLLDKPP